MFNYLYFAFLIFIFYKLVLSSSESKQLVLNEKNYSTFQNITDKCILNPCLNGYCKISQETSHGYNCYCKENYTGYNCHIKYNECNNNFCKNNSTCLLQGEDITCFCKQGFKGKYCEELIDNCLSNPCSNNSSCTNLINSYKCDCLPGFEGKKCEIDKNVCNRTLCKNGGTCQEETGLNFTCFCKHGFEGLFCEREIDACISNPCLNKGNCLKTSPGNFSCNCTCDYTGNLCEKKIIFCNNSNRCQNDGLCIIKSEKLTNDENYNYDCFCKPGFYGIHCEFKYSHCLVSQQICENNGTCINSADSFKSYKCLCKYPFQGDHCESDCRLSKTCQNESNYDNIVLEKVLPTLILTSTDSSSKIFYQNSTALSSNVISSSNSINGDLNFKKMINDIFTTSYDDYHEKKIVLDDKLKKIFNAKFNGFQDNKGSFLQFKKQEHELKKSFLVHFHFNTKQNNAILFYMQAEYNPLVFTLIYIENELLKLAFSCNSFNTILIISDKNRKISNVTNHVQLHFKLDEEFKFCSAQIQLNNSLSIYKNQTSTIENYRKICFKYFTFGSIPVNNPYIQVNFPVFKGCINKINLDNQYQYIKNAFIARNLDECDSLNICNSSPCGLHGECIVSNSTSNDHKESETWFCKCKPGYDGSFCEKASCEMKPCSNNGICLQTSDYEINCICPEKKFGDFCDFDFSKDIPRFKRESYMVFPINNNDGFLEIKFNILAEYLNQENALLFYMGQTYSSKLKTIDFICLTLHKAYIYYKINLGHGTKEISSKLSNHQNLHQLRFGYSRQFFWLSVDNNRKVEDHLFSFYNSLNLEDKLYLGGHHLLKKIDIFKDYQFFEGCILNITVRTNQFNSSFLTLDKVLSSYNVDKCLEEKCK